MLLNTLKRAVEQIQTLESDIEQMQKDNDTLTTDIKKLEDEQREGYKTFNNNTHILLERSTLNNLINDVEDVGSNADSTADYASQAQSDIENIDYYNAEEAYNGALDILRDTEKISSKLTDLLNIEDVQPIAEEGTENA